MNPNLGALEELVLLAACGLGSEAYAVTIQQRIEGEGGRDASMGAVYTALDRLEQKGYLRSHLGSVTPAKGGRRKRFYEVTGSGMAALSAVQSTRMSLLAYVKGGLQP